MTVEEIKELVAKDREYSLYIGRSNCWYSKETKTAIVQSVANGTVTSINNAKLIFGLGNGSVQSWADSLGILVSTHTKYKNNSHRPQLVTSSDSDSLLKEIEELSSLLTTKKNMVKNLLQNEYEAKLKAFNLL